MMSNRLSMQLFSAVLVVALGLGACVTTKPQVVAHSRAASSTPLPAVAWIEHVVGQTATTAAGNQITVHSVESHVAGPTTRPTTAAGADVEVCTRRDAGQSAAFDRDLFRVQVGGSTRTAIPTGRIRTPSFDGVTSIEPGRCVRGWLLFLLEREERPDAVLLLASSPIRWSVMPTSQPVAEQQRPLQESPTES